MYLSQKCILESSHIEPLIGFLATSHDPAAWTLDFDNFLQQQLHPTFQLQQQYHTSSLITAPFFVAYLHTPHIMGFTDLVSDAGLTMLESFLGSRSYIMG
jgi:hypothetical protein